MGERLFWGAPRLVLIDCIYNGNLLRRKLFNLQNLNKNAISVRRPNWPSGRPAGGPLLCG